MHEVEFHISAPPQLLKPSVLIVPPQICAEIQSAKLSNKKVRTDSAFEIRATISIIRHGNQSKINLRNARQKINKNTPAHAAAEQPKPPNIPDLR